MGEELLCEGVLEGGGCAVWGEGGEMEVLDYWFRHDGRVGRSWYKSCVKEAIDAKVERRNYVGSRIK